MSYWLCLLLFVTRVSSDCTNGWLPHDDSCYLIETGLKETWPIAEAVCLTFHSHLAEVGSARENTFIQGQLIRLGMSQSAYWVGATDLVSEGEWGWAGSEVPLTFTDWKPGQPDNHNPNNQVENCLELSAAFHYHWNDAYCNNMQFFICEKPKPFTPPDIG